MKKTDSNEKRGGIYIHIPFCVRKCAYCDFLSAPADEKTQAEYVKALQTEIYQTAKLLSENPYTVDTVFFAAERRVSSHRDMSKHWQIPCGKAFRLRKMRKLR